MQTILSPLRTLYSISKAREFQLYANTGFVYNRYFIFVFEFHKPHFSAVFFLCVVIRFSRRCWLWLLLRFITHFQFAVAIVQLQSIRLVFNFVLCIDCKSQSVRKFHLLIIHFFVAILVVFMCSFLFLGFVDMVCMLEMLLVCLNCITQSANKSIFYNFYPFCSL